MDVVEIGESQVAVLPVVRGLVSEEERVKEAFNEWEPISVALSISAEELDTLEALGDQEAALETFEEEVYVKNLRKFGKVRKPPPCFTKALGLCRENGVECVGVDMTEDEYTDAYCHFVTAIEMIRESWFKRRIAAKTANSVSPEEFVTRFDEVVNKTKGHRDLEREREKVIAHKISMLTKDRKRILAIIELERSAGVLSRLKEKRK